ncbi:internal scaffolding protein [Apis mellifera associated microvirus 17]|nr:internal scaffolding protein [Apis mellifera associated microvirus 17]
MKSQDPKAPVRRRVQLVFPKDEKKLTKQAFKDECDINNIVRKYSKTGILEHSAAGTPRIGDFSDITENHFHESMNIVARAQNAFEQLPAELRDRFANDPGRLLKFMEDPKNLEEARKLGLAAPAKEATPPSSSPSGVEPPTGDAPRAPDTQKTPKGG